LSTVALGVLLSIGAVTSSPAAGPSASVCAESGSRSGTLTLPVEGRPRTVIVHVPTADSPGVRVALVLNLHGSGSTAAEQERFTDMDAASDTDRFIVAYPQALIPDGSGYDWNIQGEPLTDGKEAPANAADDVTALVAIVRDLEQRYCIDQTRVYVTGFSGGGRMASQLACDASQTFAAIAVVSGLRHPARCPATRPVPVLAFHGTADPVDPYDGHGNAYWTYAVPQAARDWAGQDRCTTSAHDSSPAPTVTLRAYTGCADRAAVELYTISGEGHEWPGGVHLPRVLTRFLGPQSSAIDADSTIWAFFARHPRT
jgi:polyhydroxybutyrate depolymerase